MHRAHSFPYKKPRRVGRHSLLALRSFSSSRRCNRFHLPYVFQRLSRDYDFFEYQCLRALYERSKSLLFFFDYPPSDKILTVQGRRLISNLAKNSPKPIIIVNDLLIFTQPESDVHVSNFGVDKCWTLARAIATLVWKAHHRIQWRSHRPCRQSPTLAGQLQYSFQYSLDGQCLFVYG